MRSASVFPAWSTWRQAVGLTMPKLSRRASSSDTVAIVAVNLFGLATARRPAPVLSRDRQISLIQDSAQYLPRTSSEWPGDYVILSSAAARPMNLLYRRRTYAPAGSSDLRPSPSARTLRGMRLLASRAAGIALQRPDAYAHACGWSPHYPGQGSATSSYRPLDNGAAPSPNAHPEPVGAAFVRAMPEPGDGIGGTVWAPAVDDGRPSESRS